HRTSAAPEAAWTCDDCATNAVAIEPRHLIGSPAAICPRCLGLGVTRQFDFDKWIVEPDAPICAGCFRGRTGTLVGYFCQEGTGGNAALRAFAERYHFDLRTTPWSELSDEARHAFLFGEPGRTNEFSVASFVGMNYWAHLDLGGADTKAF